MKRVLYLLVLVTMLLGSFSTAFAQEPQRVDTQPLEATLGDVWWFYFDFGVPGIRVDAYLYRPATAVWDPASLAWLELGWPFAGGPQFGTWWWTPTDYPDNPFAATLNDSDMRRQSWPSYLYTDIFGYYYAEFMLPRDEVWFPCSYPLKWKCNYLLDPFGTMEWHSPVQMVYECRPIDPNFLVWECLNWPWAVDPQDTISPLEVYLIDEYGFGYIIPFEVTGMYWKFSDFE
ncbi:MAG: hypothetical protein JXA93_18090 [Anaerolineae bacterium]|nr:hypothetical protein [Anaerolineae bacterium]